MWLEKCDQEINCRDQLRNLSIQGKGSSGLHMNRSLFLVFAGFNNHKCLLAFSPLRKTISECWHRFLKIILAKDKQSSRYRNIFYTEKRGEKTTLKPNPHFSWLTVAGWLVTQNELTAKSLCSHHRHNLPTGCSRHRAGSWTSLLQLSCTTCYHFANGLYLLRFCITCQVLTLWNSQQRERNNLGKFLFTSFLLTFHSRGECINVEQMCWDQMLSFSWLQLVIPVDRHTNSTASMQERVVLTYNVWSWRLCSCVIGCFVSQDLARWEENWSKTAVGSVGSLCMA